MLLFARERFLSVCLCFRLRRLLAMPPEFEGERTFCGQCVLPGSRDGAGQQRRWPSVRARAAAQCRVGVLAAHEQTARPPASECLARSRQYSPSVLHVSYRPRRDWELGSHARLPHTEPYILFVIIFEPLIEPGSQLLARSSSTTPCPPARICLALPRLAEPGPPLAAAAVNPVPQLSAVWASASCAVRMRCACGLRVHGKRQGARSTTPRPPPAPACGNNNNKQLMADFFRARVEES